MEAIWVKFCGGSNPELRMLQVGSLADILLVRCDVSLFPPKADIDEYSSNVRFVLRVQPVTATPLVVYRLGFRIPRSSAVVD